MTGVMPNVRNGYFDVRRTVAADTGVETLSDIKHLRGGLLEEQAARVAEEVLTWAGQYPTILQNRVGSLSLCCSAMTPDDHETTVIAVKVAVLLFAIDDIVDGTVIVPRDYEADALLVACSGIATFAGAGPAVAEPALSPELAAPWREVIRAFAGYCAALAARPLAELYYPFFARMFVAAMEGMRFELRSRRLFIERREVPTYDAYLDAGKKSIASPVVYAATLVALAPTLDRATVVGNAQIMDEFALLGGACLRLANDLRSYARELEIEQRPNSVIVLMHSLGLAEHEAEAEVLARADGFLRELPGLAARLPEKLQAWAMSVERFTALMRDWYMLRELHGS
jgi:hypothetical protein